MSEQSLRDAWLWQAATCEAMDAPFTAALLRCMVEDDAARAAVWPILAPCDDPSARVLLMGAVPLRILGGFHFLVLSGLADDLAGLYASGETGGLGPAIAAAAKTHPDILADFMGSPPQTNEVRRSLGLIGGFLTVARETGLPLRCLELGASAGLNMNWDRYGYDFGGGRRWGDVRSPLTLTGEWSGGLPPLDAPVSVVEKRACDQAPIDVRSEEGALRLQAYIWPEQHDRLERLRAAIALARQTYISVDKADAVDWTLAHADPRAGVATVLYHSIFIQYPPEDVRTALIEAIHQKGRSATRDAPFAWLRMEPKAEQPIEVELRLTLWPGGEDRRLAEVHPHGAAVNWLGAAKIEA